MVENPTSGARRTKFEDGVHEKKNRFEVPSKLLRIRLIYPPAKGAKPFQFPVKNTPYVLEIGRAKRTGTTNDQGILKERVPVTATTARLSIGDGKNSPAWTINLVIAELEPSYAADGAQARLNNLGFYAGAALNGRIDSRVQRAIQRFQTFFLSTTGVPSETVPGAVAQKLEGIHGG